MKSFTPADPTLFFSRQDPKDPRLGELAESTPQEAQVALIGYPDDEGVKLNGGREGARLGPQEIRRALYKMTPHPKRTRKRFCDLGDLHSKTALAERHEEAARAAQDVLKQKQQLLSFGGGNDWAYSDGLAFLKTHANDKPLIINVDAHFDVRDLERGPNSGTPFYRLLESGIPFDFVEFGIQTHCNSKHHWDYVHGKGARILTMEEYFDSGLSLTEYTVRALGEWILRKRPTFLAVDIDAFALPFAPGASAPGPLGLLPQEFWPLYLTLLQRLDVRALGIYEVAPTLDVAAATSKWAAQLAHGFLHDV
ncbi:MAG: formimidoylglutamase [Bdellovibrionales bacterium]|nr:formimidoylglutamase [Bdellovibrionales bacterium]